MRRKRTDVWGYFKPPAPSVKELPQELEARIGSRGNSREWAKIPCPPEYERLGLSRQALRAITPPGFARAFFRANR
jgi:hypothetical protein